MSFVKTNRTEFRAVSVNSDACAAKAKKCLEEAAVVGARTKGRDGRDVREQPLVNNFPGASKLTTRHEIMLTLQAAEHFRIAGEQYWYDSAKAYGLAAALYAGGLMARSKSAELYVEAALVMEKIDPEFANEYYRKAISQHCDVSQYGQAAMLEERTQTFSSMRKDFDASIEGYSRASKLYTAADRHDDADRTLDQTAYLLGKAGKVRDAAYLYHVHAMGQAKQNLEKFNAPSTALRAGVLLLSDSLRQSPELDYSELRKMMEQNYTLDCRFEESREHAFLVDMMDCITRADLDKLADCIYSFNSLVEFDDVMLQALKAIKSAIVGRMKKIKE